MPPDLSPGSTRPKLAHAVVKGAAQADQSSRKFARALGQALRSAVQRFLRDQRPKLEAIERTGGEQIPPRRSDNPQPTPRVLFRADINRARCFKCSARGDVLYDGCDLLIVAHPQRSRLYNKSDRWLSSPPLECMREELSISTPWEAPIARIATETLVMQRHTRAFTSGFQEHRNSFSRGISVTAK